MDQRLSFVTLAVGDLDVSRRFYLDGLGWRADLDVPGEVVMVRVGEHLVLSLWDAAQFEGEVGPIRRGEGVAPITLAHNVAREEEVDAVLDLARAAGSPEVAPGERREWGGYSGYFADPDGFRWEVAVNPGPIGRVVLPPASRDEVRRTPFGQPVGPEVDGWSGAPWPAVGTITGRYCTIEALAPGHAEELRPEIAGRDHDHLWTYLGQERPQDAATFAAHIARRVDGDGVDVVVRDGAGVASGLASLMRIDTAHGVVEVGNIVLGPRLQRTSAATEATSLLAGHVFDLGYRRLEWKCDALNAPSCRAAERLGFTYEGTFRRHLVTKGRSRDTAWFAIVLDDWPRIRAAHEAWLSPDNFAGEVQRRRLADLLAQG